MARDDVVFCIDVGRKLMWRLHQALQGKGKDGQACAAFTSQTVSDLFLSYGPWGRDHISLACFDGGLRP